MDYELFADKLDNLYKLVKRADVTDGEVEQALMELVPTFKRYVPQETQL